MKYKKSPRFRTLQNYYTKDMRIVFCYIDSGISNFGKKPRVAPGKGAYFTDGIGNILSFVDMQAGKEYKALDSTDKHIIDQKFKLYCAEYGPMRKDPPLHGAKKTGPFAGG
jgi:hypothetical protein